MRYGWTLVKSEWTALPEDLVNGNSWRSVQLDLADINSVPEDHGVYVICCSPPGRRRGDTKSPNDLFGVLYTAIYVGKAEKQTLRARFGQHCRNPKEELRSSKEVFASNLDFWFIRLDVSRIPYVEAKLIDCFGPPANAIRGSISARILDPLPA